MTRTTTNYFEFDTLDRQFLCNITSDGEDRDVEVSVDEFLKYKQASPIGYIAVEVEKNIVGSDQGRDLGSYELQTQFATLEQYLDMMDDSEIEAELSIIIDRREGRTEWADVPGMADMFKSLSKTA